MESIICILGVEKKCYTNNFAWIEPHSALRTPHSALRIPQSAIRTPYSALLVFGTALSARARIQENKQVVNRAIILFTQHPHYLCYFSL